MIHKLLRTTFAGMTLCSVGLTSPLEGAIKSPVVHQEASISSMTHSARIVLRDQSSYTSNHQRYRVSVKTLVGKNASGGRWEAQYATLSGGSPTVTHAFNAASLAAVHRNLDKLTHQKEYASWSYTSTPHVYFTNHTIAQVLDGELFFQGAAHPALTVATTAVDSRSAVPLTLQRLFIRPPQALDRIARIAPHYFQQKYHMTPLSYEGFAPQEKNYSNWVPTTRGFEIHFEDYQVGPHGKRVVTIPWSQLQSYLHPNMNGIH